MRTPLIAGNWKLFKTLSEATALVDELAPLVRDIDDVEVVVAPVFTALNAVAKAAEKRLSRWLRRTVTGKRRGPSRVRSPQNC